MIEYSHQKLNQIIDPFGPPFCILFFSTENIFLEIAQFISQFPYESLSASSSLSSPQKISFPTLNEGAPKIPLFRASSVLGIYSLSIAYSLDFSIVS